MPASLRGTSFKKSIASGGVSSPALSSTLHTRPGNPRRAAKLSAGARAAYSSMMNGMGDYAYATNRLKAKCMLIAEAVLDAAERVEDHYP